MCWRTSLSKKGEPSAGKRQWTEGQQEPGGDSHAHNSLIAGSGLEGRVRQHIRLLPSVDRLSGGEADESGIMSGANHFSKALQNLTNESAQGNGVTPGPESESRDFAQSLGTPTSDRMDLGDSQADAKRRVSIPLPAVAP